MTSAAKLNIANIFQSHRNFLEPNTQLPSRCNVLSGLNHIYNKQNVDHIAPRSIYLYTSSPNFVHHVSRISTRLVAYHPYMFCIQIERLYDSIKIGRREGRMFNQVRLPMQYRLRIRILWVMCDRGSKRN